MKAVQKLGEAAFFLREMDRVQNNRTPFTFELSAFLSACKSAVNHMVGEYGREWYGSIRRRVNQGEFTDVVVGN